MTHETSKTVASAAGRLLANAEKLEKETSRAYDKATDAYNLALSVKMRLEGMMPDIKAVAASALAQREESNEP